jgi:hypothetical protein
MVRPIPATVSRPQFRSDRSLRRQQRWLLRLTRRGARCPCAPFKRLPAGRVRRLSLRIGPQLLALTRPSVSGAEGSSVSAASLSDSSARRTTTWGWCKSTCAPPQPVAGAVGPLRRLAAIWRLARVGTTSASARSTRVRVPPPVLSPGSGPRRRTIDRCYRRVPLQWCRHGRTCSRPDLRSRTGFRR